MTTRSPFQRARDGQPVEVADVALTAHQADRIVNILDLVEDFFLHHIGAGTRAALGRFAAGEGWPPPRSAAGLIDEVFFATTPLRKAISAARQTHTTTTTGSRP